jgi:hypothetical protein
MTFFDGTIGQSDQKEIDTFVDVYLNGNNSSVHTENGTAISFD